MQESLSITGTPYHLVYQSSNSRGYLSLLELCLTHPNRPPPSTLRRVLLRITIEGQRTEEILEPKRNLRYSYTWDMRNVYRQRVLGSAIAVVRVGYQYSNCTVWETRTAELAGDDAGVSEIGHWNLDVHCRYNHMQGVLTSGDGRQVSTAARTLSPFLGTRGVQRSMRPSSNTAQKMKEEETLLAPKAIATDSKGNLFLGDFDEIKRISHEGFVTTVYRFK